MCCGKIAMVDEVGDLRLLTLIVAAGNLSETARRLNSSPPVMSRRLAAIEARLGVRLIDRSSRKFRLTQEGAQLHERALRIIADIDEAEAEASSRAAVPRGRLRIGAPMQLGRRRIAPIISAFAEAFPKVEIEYVLSDSGLDPVDDDLDVAIRIDMPQDPSLYVRKLASSRRVVCAAPGYLAAHGTPQRPDDLLDHKCIQLVRGRRRVSQWVFQEEGRRKVLNIGGNLATTSGEVMHGWALEGRGVALKALWDIEEDLAAGRLVECLKPFACDAIALYAAYQRHSHMPARIEAFLDFLSGEMRAP
jgi:DNA-binding transcriptional LysR family regulator